MPTKISTETTTMLRPVDPHVAKFARFEKEAGQPSWLFPLRKAGIARFAELGFPTLQDEDWRFTNVAPIARLPFKPIFDTSRNGFTGEMIAEVNFRKLPSIRLVFVNAPFAQEL